MCVCVLGLSFLTNDDRPVYPDLVETETPSSPEVHHSCGSVLSVIAEGSAPQGGVCTISAVFLGSSYIEINLVDFS